MAARTRLAALLAAGIGLMAVVAGSRVLRGQSPGYTVIGWLPLYNVLAGVVSLGVSAVLILRRRRHARVAALLILAAHSLVLVTLLTAYRGVAAIESLTAMSVRIVVWVLVMWLIGRGGRGPQWSGERPTESADSGYDTPWRLIAVRVRHVLVVVAIAAATVAQAQQRDPKQYQRVLENPDRVAALQVDRVVAALGLTAGMRVADLGAGTGVFTVSLARAVGPGGKVFAIDIDPALLAIVREKAAAGQLGNVQTVVAGDNDPRLPEPVDLLFLSDTLHHLPDQAAYVGQFGRLLRPGGRVAIIEFAPGEWPAGHESFMILPDQVDAWMAAAGFSRVDVHTFLDTNFFHVYRMPR